MTTVNYTETAGRELFITSALLMQSACGGPGVCVCVCGGGMCVCVCVIVL